MAFAGGGLNSPSARDTAPGPRFFVFAVLSILLMYFDQRDGWSQRIRYVLQGAAYPVQVAVGSPRLLWNSTIDLFSTRATLRRENTELKARERELSLTAMRFAALEQENARLRGLANGLPPLVKRSQLADVVSADLSSQRQRLVIDQGDRAGLYRSQAIVDATGLVGQLVRVGPWSAEVMLISDPGHAVPVEVLRNGVRTVAEGTGLGGVFPAGIPVGTVVEAVRDPDDILARVRVRPRASLARDRQVMALWFNPESPMAPVDSALVRELPEAPLARPVLEPPSPVAKVTKP
jgi:rod shape-determining protein MreC